MDKLLRPDYSELAADPAWRAPMRAACRNLCNFLWYAWPHVPRADGKLNLAKYIPVLCNYLQAAIEGKRRADGVKLDRLVFNLPPECLKSVLFSVVFPAWVWTIDQRFGVLSVAYDNGLLIRDSSDSRALMESDWFKVLSPVLILSWRAR
ncbi:MAG: hypothetical protein KF752_17840 [Pirellulaceae bacterium]|nr:hypothetical protein [Pirellulaceae bacterium]